LTRTGRGAPRATCKPTGARPPTKITNDTWVHTRLACTGRLHASPDTDRDPQRFWTSVADALRDTAAGSSLVRPLTAALDLDGWAVIERLRVDISPDVRVPLVDLATNPPTG
jgi:hypothetical protein